METYNKILSDLITLNHSNRERSEKTKKIMSKFQWLREFCTIHLNVGRITGKSSFIVNISTNRDLIVVNSDASKRIMKEKLLNVGKRDFSIISNLLDTEKLKGKRFEVMYIDEPSLCFQRIDKAELYEFFIFNGTDFQTVIMLGE